jgi:hypothetical protein
MFIFIDESGSFALPPAGNLSLCCVGALVIPDGAYFLALNKFDRLKANWRSSSGEIKGSQLNEKQIAKVIEVLVGAGAKFFVAATEMSLNPEQQILERRESMGERLMAAVTSGHSPNVRTQMEELVSTVRAMPAQLFVQYLLLADLVDRILRVMPTYYAFAGPQELATFRWTFDGKDQKRTRFEACLSLLTALRLQSSGLKDPAISVVEGDYSYFQKAFGRSETDWPKGIPVPEPTPGAVGAENIDIGKILRTSSEFKDSRESGGLQLADIVINAFRRAVSGRLQPTGWDRLGELMLTMDARKPPFDLVVFSGVEAHEAVAVPQAYDVILKKMWRRSKSALEPMIDRMQRKNASSHLAADSIARCFHKRDSTGGPTPSH